MAEERIVRLMKRVPLFAKMNDDEVAQVVNQCVQIGRASCRERV